MNGKKRIKSLLFQLFALLLGILIVMPIIYALLISFMQPNQILTVPPTFIPKVFTLENYKKALEYTNLPRYMLNSLLLAGGASAIRLITGSLAAFAFAFFDFWGRRFLFMLVLGTMMIPMEVVLVTNYQTVSSLGLINTYLGMMTIFMVSAVHIFLMRQHFLSYSRSLRDAASIDGCSNFRFLTQILLPSSTSILTTVFISSFIGIWNTYLWPLMVTNANDMRTVQVGITMLNFPEGSVHGPIMAASILILLPSMLVFIIFQRRIMAGMMNGAVKG